MREEIMEWVGNRRFISRIGTYLKIMERQARERGAPVYTFEKSSQDSPFKILVYTMLSARTKDEVTIAASQRLFAVARTPKEIAEMDEARIARLIRPAGFYRTKARHLRLLCRRLADGFGGRVPDNLAALLSLPGVGVKTAHIVLARAFGRDVIGVDVHVHRISNRLGLVKARTPMQASALLNKKIPKRYRRDFNRVLVGFGQTVCKPLKPKCAQCKLLKLCPRIGLPPL